MVNQITAYNRYPEWLSLQLEAIPIKAQEYDLFLTLNCREQWQDFLAGKIKWGIKGGLLKVTSDNCEIVPSLHYPENAFHISISEASAELVWTFSLKTSQFAFNGSLEALRLGTVTFLESSSRLSATFILAPEEISITDTEGLWKHDITPNKHGILERKIAQCLYFSQLQGDVSGVQLSFEKMPLEPISVEPRSDYLVPLKEMISQVYHAETNDLFSLAKLTDLDPNQDLAGGSLLGMELSGVQWGGANLYHINLRGTNLTDADLSEANLSYAKLSGADLSGAYLGSANLSYAHLNKASLALSNLIGANLQGANLEGANLSNANFSGAIVLEAQFGNNVGMTEEMQQSLRARGAKILE